MLVLFVFLLSFVVAVELTIIDEPGSFSGAILKVRASGSSGEYGDKIYPSENYCDAGVLKFDIETSLSKGDLSIVFTKDSEPVDEFEDGPFDFSNDTLLIDLREPIEVEVVSGFVNSSDKESINVTEEVEDEFSGNDSGVTGNSIFDVGVNFRYYFMGVFVFLGVFVLLFFLIRMAYKSGAESELKSLGRMKLDEKLDKLEG